MQNAMSLNGLTHAIFLYALFYQILCVFLCVFTPYHISLFFFFVPGYFRVEIGLRVSFLSVNTRGAF